MRALDDMVRSGKILYIGISDAPAWIVSYADAIAKFRGWTPFIGIQIMYNFTHAKSTLIIDRLVDYCCCC
jgi:aryl-alcohol dehydrogenase-like predicted oxidoreductase